MGKEHFKEIEEKMKKAVEVVKKEFTRYKNRKTFYWHIRRNKNLLLWKYDAFESGCNLEDCGG